MHGATPPPSEGLRFKYKKTFFGLEAYAYTSLMTLSFS